MMGPESKAQQISALKMGASHFNRTLLTHVKTAIKQCQLSGHCIAGKGRQMCFNYLTLIFVSSSHFLQLMTTLALQELTGKMQIVVKDDYCRCKHKYKEIPAALHEMLYVFCQPRKRGQKCALCFQIATAHARVQRSRL